MEDVLIFFVWMVGLTLAVVVIVAQCQLFAIRRLLETLVRQGGGDPSVGSRGVMADLPPKTAVLPARKFKDDAAKAAYLADLDDTSLLATWKSNPEDALVEHEVRTRGFYVG